MTGSNSCPTQRFPTKPNYFGVIEAGHYHRTMRRFFLRVPKWMKIKLYATRLPRSVQTFLQKKSQATIVSTCIFTNVRHGVVTPLDACRSGSGIIPSSTSTRRTELRLGVNTSFRSSPTIRRFRVM